MIWEFGALWKLSDVVISNSVWWAPPQFTDGAVTSVLSCEGMWKSCLTYRRSVASSKQCPWKHGKFLATWTEKSLQTLANVNSLFALLFPYFVHLLKLLSFPCLTLLTYIRMFSNYSTLSQRYLSTKVCMDASRLDSSWVVPLFCMCGSDLLYVFG